MNVSRGRFFSILGKIDTRPSLDIEVREGAEVLGSYEGVLTTDEHR